jgi:hypothetical protein
MKRLGGLVLVLVLLSGCAQGQPQQSAIPTPVATGIAASSPAHAFAAIVSWLYAQDPGLNQKMLAVDAASAGLEDPAALMALLAQDPAFTQHTVRDATKAQLEAEGLIKKGIFTHGALYTFTGVRISDGVVTAKGSKWVTGDAAYGASFTVRLVGEKWTLDATGVWIS